MLKSTFYVVQAKNGHILHANYVIFSIPTVMPKTITTILLLSGINADNGGILLG